MPPRITVIAHVETNDSALAELVESLDAQSLSYRDFSVVLLVPESAAALRRRLEQLAARRPNVVIQPFEGRWSDALCSTIAAVRTPAVLPLSPHLNGGATRLHPEALTRLADFLQTNGCDVVLGRSSWSSEQTPIPFALRHDVARIDKATARMLMTAATLAYRSEFIRTHLLLRDASDLDRIDATASIGVLGSYPIAVRVSGADDSALANGDAVALEIQNITASWRDGRILLAADPPSTGADPICVLSIRSVDTGLEYWLPAAPDAPSAWELDVRSADRRPALSDGQWSLMSNAYAADGKPVARSATPAAPLGPGIVDGKLVVPASVKGTFVIDVGARRFSPVPPFDADRVHLTEDAGGALFSARLPEIYATGPADIDGTVMLDRFSLPARLTAAEHEANLHFFVSGLAGESTIATRFGAAPAAPTGLNLVITGTGEIGVAPTPPPPPPAPPPHKPTKKAVARKPSPLVTRLRRAVPAPLEPVARRLSRNRFARRLYRRMMRG